MNGAINHIDSSFISSIRSESPVLSFIENIDRILNLTKSQYPQLQHTGMFSLSELTFQRFRYMVTVFAKFRSFTPILTLLASKEKKTRDIVISLLWNFSAEESLKIKMFDEGIFDYIFENMDKLGEDQTLAISAIIQNLSEYRFEKGIVNPNQLKISKNRNLMKLVLERARSKDKKIKFLSCLTICNLSMHEDIRINFIKEGHLEPIMEFINEYVDDYQFPATFNWVTLQPHVPLLESKDVEVQSFVLYCINSFASGSRYDRSLWKGLMENKGAMSLIHLTKSKNTFVSSLANKISNILGIGESSILINDSEDEIRQSMIDLYNQSLFTDFIIGCGNESFKVHKSICLTRCPKLKDIIKEQSQNINVINDTNGIPVEYLEVPNENMFAMLREIFKHLYGFQPILTESSAKIILKYSDRLDLHELKQICEFYLWHYITCDNAGEYLDISMESNADQLKQVVVEFIIRNIGTIYNGNFTYYIPNSSPTPTAPIMRNSGGELNLETCKIESDEEDEEYDEPTSSNTSATNSNNNNNNNNNSQPNNIKKKQSKWRGQWNDHSKEYVYQSYKKFLDRQKKEIFQLNLEVMNQ